MSRVMKRTWPRERGGKGFRHSGAQETVVNVAAGKASRCQHPRWTSSKRVTHANVSDFRHDALGPDVGEETWKAFLGRRFRVEP